MVPLNVKGGLAPAGLGGKRVSPSDQAILKQGVKQNDPST